MSLTFSDVFVRVQRTFGDEAAVQVTEADVIRWVNDAQREAVMQNEGLLPKVGFLDSVIGQDDYTLPTDLFTLHHVYFKESDTSSFFALKWLTKFEFSQMIDGWDGNEYSSGFPQVYTTENSKLILFPKPQTAVTGAIKLDYSRYPVAVADNNDPIDLPPYLHTYVVNFCLMQAYEMDEDWESADKKAQQVQGDLNFNNNRQAWFGRESYPSVATTWEDYE